ncbi:hypothetical protein SeMB42_g05016 [Synchytrium endobioticum]|uniref:Uncharacterized protein n=1 Tax=Synchytrium endobioticum TaxID=286115 RepID=A0A507CH23_9FUNG|nr:hypothetical protein SeLEV6574_g06599 [Synchytrium endobioticum]TPX42722.1 hypothetical protein SeMB42_g05016 [Synchytrium endobioticum]
MRKSASRVVNNRPAALGNPFLGYSDAALLQRQAQIAEIVLQPIALFYPFAAEQLLQEPNETKRPSQVYFTSAYHSLVFEKLKTLFLKIQHRIMEQRIPEVLKNGLDSVSPHLLRHQDLERKCRELYAIGKWRELKLPDYDWEPVRNILRPNLVAV